MSFSYDSTALATPLNHLRFLVQDTSDAGHFLEDEEITFTDSQETNIYRAAARLARTIAAQLAKTPSQENTIITFDAQARSREYRLLAEDYDKKANKTDESLKNGTDSSLNLPSFPTNCVAFTRKLHHSD